MVKKRTTVERPRVEPEIIPPDRSRRGSTWRPDGYAEAGTTHRIYIAKVGPFGFVLLALALAALIAVIGLFVLGVFLIWLPIVAAIIIGGVIFGWFRR